MNNEFKPGDIVITVPSLYTTALLVSMNSSVMRPGSLYGKVIPMFGIFAIGPFLYEAELSKDWEKAELTEKVIIEAKRALSEAWKQHAVDNLTYIELLNILNEQSKSK